MTTLEALLATGDFDAFAADDSVATVQPIALGAFRQSLAGAQECAIVGQFDDGSCVLMRVRIGALAEMLENVAVWNREHAAKMN